MIPFRALPIRQLFSVLLTFVLIFSLGLHAIQIEHDHFAVPHGHADPGEQKGMGINLDLVMHLSDKKLFLLGLIALFPITTFRDKKEIISRLLLSAFQATKIACGTYGVVPRIHDFHRVYFRRGIFHSKAY